MITIDWPDRTKPEAFNTNGVIDKVAVPAWDTHGKNVGNSANFPMLKRLTGVKEAHVVKAILA